jgi:glycosyltransferase involved in cell wall biosynthesis
MKVAIYTIALNEEQFVERWYESAKEADYLLIADTGSTDGTVALAKSLGINVVEISIKPWRFDDARNASLAYIPSDIDYCIALDMDEVLIEGWRQKLETVPTQTTRPRYKYTWSWKTDGTPGLQYGGDKIHSRYGYRWKHPVHEVMVCDRIEQIENWIDLEIHHHPDDSKPRSQYMPLLAQSVVEDPHDDRNAFYYARELYFYGEYQKSTEEFKRHLSLPRATWKPERAASMRYISKMDDEFETSEWWLKQAIAEAPDRREAYVEMAKLCYEKGLWSECLASSQKALEITNKPLEYLCEEFAWGFAPYDYAAIAAYNLGFTDVALEYGMKAVELNPTDERLQRNIMFYKQ